ncbi:MAG: tRNA (adenosine(37)-N6)-threonylcarbamoyltransferase complex dimerization subunit type 1 TsaB [Gammaproteobacteria bacterium]|nr:tRNA (adenosine(37)-N6)-threonylcarbamoyltransferase complex dimerization subunit type 1 TsaB [Gammaproteobacteria bacterium]
MKILAIDTSTTACSVALLIDDKVHSLHEVVPMQQAQLILPMIDGLLNTAGVKLAELDALAFGCGPGSFTGVRIATSVMQGLALATQLPLISISSLAVVAQAAYLDLGWQKLLVVMDARMQEVYWGAYTVNKNGLVELQGVENVTPPELVVEPTGSDWSGVGTGWGVFQDRIVFRYENQDVTRLPMATALLPLAKEKYQKQEWLKPEEALPVYLRDNVAKKEKR